MIVYCQAPIDFWDGWRLPSEIYSEDPGPHFPAESEFDPDNSPVLSDGPFRCLPEWNALWDQAKTLARQIGWQGDVQGPLVSMIPKGDCDPECAVLIGWKQRDDGTTFIASPSRLPWLETFGRWIDSSGREGEV